MLMNSVELIAGTILTLAGYLLAGRLAGFGITAVWAAAMAYFLMPPIFSWRVSHPRDVATLVLYGTVGLVLARTSPARKQYPAVVEQDTAKITPSVGVRTYLEVALSELMSSNLGARLRGSQIAVNITRDAALSCAHADVLCILSTIFDEILAEVPEVRRISICAVRQPGLERLSITAHRAWPLPLHRTILIGMCDKECARLEFPGWPQHISATWFENGYGRIYQVSIRQVSLREPGATAELFGKMET